VADEIAKMENDEFCKGWIVKHHNWFADCLLSRLLLTLLSSVR